MWIGQFQVPNLWARWNRVLCRSFSPQKPIVCFFFRFSRAEARCWVHEFHSSLRGWKWSKSNVLVVRSKGLGKLFRYPLTDYRVKTLIDPVGAIWCLVSQRCFLWHLVCCSWAPFAGKFSCIVWAWRLLPLLLVLAKETVLLQTAFLRANRC